MIGLHDFILESNRIEGILREPTEAEMDSAAKFLNESLSLESLCKLQSVISPGKPLRARVGLDVRVGNHFPPRGGPEIIKALNDLLCRIGVADSWQIHIEYEELHPFMDGNGRTGRLLWAWQMNVLGELPFAIPFLHRFYYQSLDHLGRQ